MRIAIGAGKFIESEDIKELKIITIEDVSKLLYVDNNNETGVIISGSREELINLVKEMNRALIEETPVIAIFRK